MTNTHAGPDLLRGPILPTIVRLASPNVLGLFAQTLTIAYDGYIVARLGIEALAAVALVFPLSIAIWDASARVRTREPPHTG